MDLPHYLNTWNCLQVKTFQTSPQLDNYQITLQVHSKFGNYTWKKKKKWKLYKRRERVEVGLTHIVSVSHLRKQIWREQNSPSHQKKEQNTPFFWLIFSKKRFSIWENLWLGSVLVQSALTNSNIQKSWVKLMSWTKLINSIKIMSQIYNLWYVSKN